jgi:hypothetical protein
VSQRFTPRRSGRGTGNYEFFELALALGPQAIGVTGDNSYETLYGREYLLVWDLEDDLVKLYRETATDGAWERITAGLPPLFDTPLPATERHVTFAFDQSARVIVAYQNGDEVFVTRWDATVNAYVQGPNFAGVDPCLLMDATVVDPRGYPSAADGWSVQEAYYGGIQVLFRWTPDGAYRTNVVTDSDVVLFFLTPDRTGVRARVQRQLFGTANSLFDYAQPIVMDRAVALSGAYQLLVSDAAGDKRADMLISNAYVDDYIINPIVDDAATATGEPLYFNINEEVGLYSGGDLAVATGEPRDFIIVEEIIIYEAGEVATATGEPWYFIINEEVALREAADSMVASAEPVDFISVREVVEYSDANSMVAAGEPLYFIIQEE